MDRDSIRKEFLKIFIGLESYKSDSSKCALVGGQSLFLWMLLYQDRIKDPEGTLFLAAESDDIDFLSNREASNVFIEDFNESLRSNVTLSEFIDRVEVKRAGAFESTPSVSALLIYTVESPTEKPIIIDFISEVKGLSQGDLRDFSSQPLAGNSITILTPEQVLKSRLANLFGLPYGDDRKAREVLRVKIASLIMAEYIRDNAQANDIKTARNLYQSTYEIASGLNGIRFFVENGIDITRPLPDPKAIGLGDAFCEKQLPKLKEMLNKKRQAAFNRIENSVSPAKAPPIAKIVEIFRESKQADNDHEIDSEHGPR